MNKVYIGIGSNIGDKLMNIESALSRINTVAGRILVRSPLYETDPWGFEANDRFLNQVVLIDTTLKPSELLAALQSIERSLGRKRSSHGYESRTIDLDILFFDESILKEPHLTIPHPLIQDRMFVLRPLADIAPGLIHPVLKKSIKELAGNCTDKSFIRKSGTK